MGYTKIQQYGNITEIFQYEREITKNTPAMRKAHFRKSDNRLYYAIYGTSDIPGKRKKLQRLQSKAKGLATRSRSSVNRSRKNFFMLCHENNCRAETINFVTLTFAYDLTYKKASRYVSDFISRVSSHFKELPVAYISVPELTKKGRYHFHLLVYNLPPEVSERERKTRNLQRQFRGGFLDICPATYTSEGIAGYMAKYMAKALRCPKNEAVRGYTCSRNINRPRTKGSNSLDEYMAMIVPTESILPPETSCYNVPYLGKCTVTKIVKKI